MIINTSERDNFVLLKSGHPFIIQQITGDKIVGLLCGSFHPYLQISGINLNDVVKVNLNQKTAQIQINHEDISNKYYKIKLDENNFIGIPLLHEE